MCQCSTSKIQQFKQSIRRADLIIILQDELSTLRSHIATYLKLSKSGFRKLFWVQPSLILPGKQQCELRKDQRCSFCFSGSSQNKGHLSRSWGGTCLFAHIVQQMKPWQSKVNWGGSSHSLSRGMPEARLLLLWTETSLSANHPICPAAPTCSHLPSFHLSSQALLFFHTSQNCVSFKWHQNSAAHSWSHPAEASLVQL